MNLENFMKKTWNKKIYVTGASGWVGRTFLHELQSLIPPEEFNEVVVAFGSKLTSLQSTNYPSHDKIIIPIKPLTELANQSKEKDILLFHSAFLTKDRMSIYGKNEFIEVNQTITNTVLKFLENVDGARVINISSGAASMAEKNTSLSTTISHDPYGYLKLCEERRVSEIANTQILRIYALTGRFIRDPKEFALGDLLLRAIKREPLIIKATCPVIRSYVSASDVAKCAIQWLLSSDKSTKPIGASSHITTLVSLASLIAKKYNLPSPSVKPFTDAPNSYSCSPILFDRMLHKYRIKPMPLIDQINDTANGLENYSS